MGISPTSGAWIPSSCCPTPTPSHGLLLRGADPGSDGAARDVPARRLRNEEFRGFRGGGASSAETRVQADGGLPFFGGGAGRTDTPRKCQSFHAEQRLDSRDGIQCTGR